MLRLTGLEVVFACIQARRPASALYYLDMYCDNVFGGSSDCLRSLGESNVECVDGDVSGFGVKELDRRQFEDDQFKLKDFYNR